MSLFIVFEGGEASGKSTQARALYRKLCYRGIPAVFTIEPGGTLLGNRIRRILKNSGSALISPEAELFLFSASRAQLLDEVISPALQAGKIVICDRFSASTIAYQGYGRGLSMSTIEMVNSLTIQNLVPDITILLDISPEEGMARRRDIDDRFESMDFSFHRRVREGYLKMASLDSNSWEIIDASISRKEIARIIWHKIIDLIEKSRLSV